jgi:hypothetical protein
VDIWTYKIFCGVGQAFLPVWLLGVVGGIILTARLARRPDQRHQTKRILNGLLFGVVGYFLLLGSASLIHKLAVAHRFESLVERPPDAVVIGSGGGAVTLSDPAAVTELLRTIDRGQRVSAHHSHPVHEIHLSFTHIGYTYALGRDSQRDGEFWLEWVAYPGSGPPRDLGLVRRFRSEELGHWLETSGRVGGG